MTASRSAAVRVLGAVLASGAYSDTILDILLSRDKTLSAEDRALATEISYGALRNLGRIDYVLSRFSRRPLKDLDQDVINILRAAVYQLLFLEKVPAYAAVDEAVKLAALFGKRSAGGFVNGILRNALRGMGSIDYPTEEKDIKGYLAIVCSLPPWLSRLLVDRFGARRAAVIGRRYIERPPIFLRPNALVTTRDDLLADLTRREYTAAGTHFSPFGVVVRSGGALFRDEGFVGGRFSIQDEASQLAPIILRPGPGMDVLDVCSAPGIKGSFCAELMGDRGRVMAVEINPNRAAAITENVRRLGIRSVHVVAADITKSPIKSVAMFDRVLVDPPCSALGVLRRNPEIKWNLNEDDLTALARRQEDILSAAARYVKKGGMLVYSVCTINPDEGKGVVEGFLREHRDFSLDDVTPMLGEGCASIIEGGAVFSSPDRIDESETTIPDGFYIARIVRR